MRSMMEPNSDVQDLTGEPRGSGPPAAGTPAHAVKKRSILGFFTKVVTALSPSKAPASGTATPGAAQTSTGQSVFADCAV
jgi:hypothetical protein